MQRLAVFGQAVGQAHAQGFLAAYAAAGEDHVHGVALADQAWQAHGAAIHQRHAPASAVDAEHRRAGRHAQIAPQGEFQAAGHRVALHCRYHGLAEGHAGGA